MKVCRKCKKPLPNESRYCLYCGAALEKQPEKKKKATRRPNDTGTIRTLSGRSKPYAAYLPRRFGAEYIGSYATRREASEALIAAIAAIPPTSRALWTVQQFFDAYINAPERQQQSAAMSASMRAAWTFCTDIAQKKMRDVKAAEWQACIDKAAESGKSKSTASNIRALASLLCKEAMRDDVISRNYAPLLRLKGAEKRHKDIFTLDEIAMLKANDSDIQAKFILILIYTGMRISELLQMQCADVHLDQGYMQGGVKSDAGKNRVIPILPLIEPYVIWFFNQAGGLGYLIQRDHKPVLGNFARKQWFYAYLADIGILTAEEIQTGAKPRLTPHCTRHTFASMAREAGIQTDVLTRVIGHSTYDITDTVYVDMSPQYLSGELKKLESSKKAE